MCVDFQSTATRSNITVLRTSRRGCFESLQLYLTEPLLKIKYNQSYYNKQFNEDKGI